MGKQAKLSVGDKEFYRGFACAVATLARNGYPSMALDIMKTNGVTYEDFRNAKVDSFDLGPIRREIRFMGA